MAMTSRERVILSLNHKEPDRVPIDLGGMRSTGIMAAAYDKLRKHLGPEVLGDLLNEPVHIYDIGQMLAEIEEPVRRRFHVDVVPIEPFTSSWRSIGYAGQWEPRTLFDGTRAAFPKGTLIEEREDGWYLLDGRGAAVSRMPKGGFYFDAIGGKGDLTADPYMVPVERYNPSASIRDEELEFLQARFKWYYENTDYALFGWGYGTPFMSGVVGSWANWLCLLVTEPDYCREILEKSALAAVERMKLVNQAVGEYCQIWGIAADDMGSQKGEFINPQIFHDLVLPAYKTVCDYFRNNTSMKTFLHCCGSVYHLIGDFIEAGIDILNPVQTSAANMDPLRLKQEFGDGITFWGGGCDTQNVLLNSTPEEIDAHIRERMDIFKPGGGFIFNQVHNIQQNVPPENAVAMLDAAYKYGGYGL